ncbi:MAG: flagellar hook-basal body protein [Dissulfurispiraceae bacterium]
MYKGIYTAITGSNLKLMELDNVANNLANVSTNGFKRTSFSSRLYPMMEGLSQAAPSTLPNARAMAWIGKDAIDTSQGTLQTTGHPLDTAINGEGFFVVDANGQTNFTRNGSFTVDKDGFLTTSGGNKVLGITDKPINIGKDITASPVISSDGSISVDGNNVGQLKVVKVTDIKYLAESLFSGKSAGPASGQIKQGSIERSNVNPLRELVNMVTTQRQFDSIQQVIKSFDQLTERAVTEIAKV